MPTHVDTHRRTRRTRTLAVLGALALALALTACAAKLTGPAGVVQTALELRRDLVSDAKRYDVLFADSTIGAQLAKDSEAATQNPLPEWKPPYVAEEAATSASVVVVWSPGTEARFKEWPKATLFSLEQTAGLWVITDAQVATGTVPPAKAKP
jgi:hypothetical protein